MILQILVVPHHADVILRHLQEVVNLLDRIFGRTEGLYFPDRLYGGKRLIVDCFGNALAAPLGCSMELGSWVFIIGLSMKGWCLLFEITLLFLYGFWWELTINLECGGLIIDLFDLRLLDFTASLAHIPFADLLRLFIHAYVHRNRGCLKIIQILLFWILSWIRMRSLPLRCDCSNVFVPSVSFWVGVNHIQT